MAFVRLLCIALAVQLLGTGPGVARVPLAPRFIQATDALENRGIVTSGRRAPKSAGPLMVLLNKQSARERSTSGDRTERTQ